jgi:fructokinase
MTENRLVGGIEFGGTKTVVAIGHSDGQILASETFATGTPTELITQIRDFFAGQSHGRIAALGCGAFGPIVLDPMATGYGCLLETNKPGWSGFDLVKALRSACDVPVSVVTDVAAAGMGEARLGALRGINLGVYLTIGTGIGGAILMQGMPLPALLHPEMGHLELQREAHDASASTCNFHSSCAEGLAAGPAIIARYGFPLSHFDPAGCEVAQIAGYIGQLCAAIVLMLSPRRVVIGGGVGKTAGFVAATHQAMIKHLGPYAAFGLDEERFLCPPELGENAGIVGALLAALQGEVSSKI